MWNVNIHSIRHQSTNTVVLIETLWNVNTFGTGIHTQLVIYVLIETLWNVNFDDEFPGGSHEIVLIETLWNVNESVLFGSSKSLVY